MFVYLWKIGSGDRYVDIYGREYNSTMLSQEILTLQESTRVDFTNNPSAYKYAFDNNVAEKIGITPGPDTYKQFYDNDTSCGFGVCNITASLETDGGGTRVVANATQMEDGCYELNFKFYNITADTSSVHVRREVRFSDSPNGTPVPTQGNLKYVGFAVVTENDYYDGYFNDPHNYEWFRLPDGGETGDSGTMVYAFKRWYERPETPTGGDKTHPAPDPGPSIKCPWSLGVTGDASYQIWMSSRIYYDDETRTTSWTTPSLMSDTKSFQTEWAKDDDAAAFYEQYIASSGLTNLPSLETTASSGTVIYKVYIDEKDGSVKEEVWRDDVDSELHYGKWSDNANGAKYMAWSNRVNGIWQDWSVAKIVGEDGKDGITNRNVMAFITLDNEESVPQLPGNPIWYVPNYGLSGQTNGWTMDCLSESGKFTWTTSGNFVLYNGVYYLDDNGWTTPARITGKDGVDGADGNGIEFIYLLFKDMDAYNEYVYGVNEQGSPEYNSFVRQYCTEEGIAEIASVYQVDDFCPDNVGYAGEVWADNAHGITEEMKVEVACSRKKVKKGDTEEMVWEPFSKPFIWASWGEDGIDGDGVEYIYQVTTAAIETEKKVALEVDPRSLTDEEKNNAPEYIPADLDDYEIDDVVKVTETGDSGTMTVTYFRISLGVEYSYPYALKPPYFDEFWWLCDKTCEDECREDNESLDCVECKILRDYYQLPDFVPGDKILNDVEKAQRGEGELPKIGRKYGYTGNYNFLKAYDYNWTDNPLDVGPGQPFEWVAVRKYKAGTVETTKEWQGYSVPRLWATYKEGKPGVFTSMVFTRTNRDISEMTLCGGTYDIPLPGVGDFGMTSCETEDYKIIYDRVYQRSAVYSKTGDEELICYWYDTVPELGGNNIWMSMKIFGDEASENQGWTSPVLMTDTTDFNVEWCQDELSEEQMNLVKCDEFNFSNFTEMFPDDDPLHTEAEAAWEAALASAETGSRWSDDGTDAVYMATTTYVHGKWTNWNVSKIKGEKGDSYWLVFSSDVIKVTSDGIVTPRTINILPYKSDDENPNGKLVTGENVQIVCTFENVGEEPSSVTYTNIGVSGVTLEIQQSDKQYEYIQVDLKTKREGYDDFIIRDTKSIPIMKDGISGSSPYTFDLTNENATVNCNNDGVIIGEVPSTCFAKFKYGGQPVTDASVLSAYTLNNRATSGLTFTYHYPEGMIVIDFSDGSEDEKFAFEGKTLQIEVYAKVQDPKLGEIERTKIMTIQKVFGEGAVSYWLVLSCDEAHVTIDGSDRMTVVPSAITANAMMQVGGERPTAATGCTIYYDYDTENPQTEYSGKIVIDGSKDYMSFILKNNGDIVDGIETVSIMDNGRSPYRIDLTNENTDINCDSEGNILPGAVRPTCTAKLTYGPDDVPDAKYSIPMDGYSLPTTGVSINELTGELTFNPGDDSNPFNFTGGTTLEITIVAKVGAKICGRAIMSISKNIAARSITDVGEYYLLSDDNEHTPAYSDPAWTAATLSNPTAEKPYLWNYEVIGYSHGEPFRTTPAIIAIYTENGRGILDIVEYYQINNSTTAIPTVWTRDRVIPNENNPYLWNYEVILYDDATSAATTPVIIGIRGDNGDPGRGIDNIQEWYAVNNDMEHAPASSSSAWSTSVQTPSADARYLWNKEQIFYSNDTSTTTDPAIIGTYSEDGKYISNLIEYYGISNNPTAIPTVWEEGLTNLPTDENPYLWNKELPVYNDGSYGTETTPVIIGIKGAKGIDAVSYWFTLSADALKVNKDEHVTPNTITITQWMQIGDNEPTSEGFTATFYWDFDTMEPAHNNAHKYNGSITITDAQALAHDYLTIHMVFGTKTIKRETVLIQKDGKDGLPGEQGPKGATVRGPVDWNKEVTTAARNWYSGEGETGFLPESEQWIDIIFYDGHYYVCTVSHSTTTTTTWSQVSSKWRQADNEFDFIATKVLLANNASIDFLSNNELYLINNGVVTGGAMGGNGLNFWAGADKAGSTNAPFRVYNNGALYASGATISGILHADSGNIGCLNVDTNGNIYHSRNADVGRKLFEITNDGEFTVSQRIGDDYTYTAYTLSNQGYELIHHTYNGAGASDFRALTIDKYGFSFADGHEGTYGATGEGFMFDIHPDNARAFYVDYGAVISAETIMNGRSVKIVERNPYKPSSTMRTYSGYYNAGSLKVRGTWTDYDKSSEITYSGITTDGSVSSVGGFFQTSDARYKNIGEPLSNVLSKIDKIDTVYYTLKDDKENKRRIGTTAQSLLKDFPEFVSGSEEDKYDVNYAELSVLALAAIKELKKEVQDLKDEIKKLKNQ